MTAKMTSQIKFFIKSKQNLLILLPSASFQDGTDNPLPIFTQTLHRSHLNKRCYGMLHPPLKCNLVNFDILNGFLYVLWKSIWDIKIDKITFQRGV